MGRTTEELLQQFDRSSLEQLLIIPVLQKIMQEQLRYFLFAQIVLMTHQRAMGAEQSGNTAEALGDGVGSIVDLFVSNPGTDTDFDLRKKVEAALKPHIRPEEKDVKAGLWASLFGRKGIAQPSRDEQSRNTPRPQ